MIAQASTVREPGEVASGDLLGRPVEVPAESRYFWSVVPAPRTVRPGPIPIGIAADVQADIPVDLAELHAVCAPSRTGEPRLLVCAARRTDLVTYLDGPERLTPHNLPDFAVDLGVDPDELNLLVGEFLPRPLRRRRERRHVFAALAVLACVAMVWIGMHRREGAARALSLEAAGHRSALLEGLDTVPRSPDQLLRRVNELTQLKHALAASPPSDDAAAVLSGVLAAWPASLAPSPESLNVQPGVVTATVSIDGEVRPALDAFAAAAWPVGWTFEPPQLTKNGDRTRLAITLRKAAQSPKPN